jgi:ESS family glutamate:Na+ symporter
VRDSISPSNSVYYEEPKGGHGPPTARETLVQAITLSELHTFAVGLASLAVGLLLLRRIPLLGRLDVPTPVVGGVIVALIVALLRAQGWIEILFSSGLSDFFLLVFFTTVGLSAKLSLLKAGGKPLLLVCATTVLLILAQNLVGVLVALGFGAHPYYGLLAGSISLVGGPGTAAAWASQAQAAGLASAPVVGVAGATLATVVGALVAGPLTGWFIRRRKLHGPPPTTQAPWLPAVPGRETAGFPTIERTMLSLLLIIIAVLIGEALNSWVGSTGLIIPGFLSAMLGGVLIANLAGPLKVELDSDLIERNGQIALQAFLAMYLMTLKLWTIGGAILPLVLNIGIQVAVTSLVAFTVLFRSLGRDYDAALTAGGFLGFGLSSMAVGMATMDKIGTRYGPSPKAFLLITLAGSFFVDLANAFIVQMSLLLPIFQ